MCRFVYDWCDAMSNIILTKLHFLFRLKSRKFILKSPDVMTFVFNTMDRSFWWRSRIIQDGPFWGCWRMGVGPKSPPSLKSATHFLKWWKLIVIPYLKKDSENISITWHTTWILPTWAFFTRNQQLLLFQEMQL